MFNKKITNLILFLAVAVFLFGSGYKLGEYKTRTTGSPNNSLLKTSRNFDFSLFWETWDKLSQNYIDKGKLNQQNMYYGAIKGMVASVGDPYTFFLTPDENKATKEDLGGKFEGIGAQLGLKDNRVIVVAPIKDSPAMKAGVRAGDYINKVDGQLTKNWTLPETVTKIRGPKGTKVALTLERDSKEFDVIITREQINVSSVDLTYETKNNQKLANLKLSQFGDNTNDEWDKAVDEVVTKWQNKEIKGMILDLRDNPGGYLESSVYVASEFLPVGKTVVKQESSTSENKTYEVSREGRLLDIPLVVLINKGSASAAEILAGALRDYKRAKLVGEKSFGKGSVQEAYDLDNGAGLHVTVSKWILPNGDWINSKGIQPDISVENQLKDGNTLTHENDTQLEKAIDQLIQ